MPNYFCRRILFFIGMTFAGSVLGAAETAGSDIVSEAVAVRSPGEDGVAVYRIPGLVRTKAGTLIAVFDLRHNSADDLPADIDVGSSRSTDGGKTWEPTRVVFDFHAENEAMEGVGDPSILVDETTGRIWAAAVWAHNGRSLGQSQPGMEMGKSAQFVLAYSDDDGLSWSEPVNITPQFAEEGKTWRLVFQGPGSGITTKDGVLVFPAQFWNNEGAMAFSTIISSRDHGETWTIGTGAFPLTSEAQVVELADGRLMLNMRNESRRFETLPPEIQKKYPQGDQPAEKKRVVCVSDDFGQTWTEDATSRKSLPEPVCQASLIRVESKASGGRDVLAFFNPKSFTARDTMTLQLSDDDGQTWTRSILVDPASCYGYSSMAMVDSERIGILYESNGGLLFRTVHWRDVP